jgi:pimeloyl-ACP methyl ester carboxylesterase
MQTNYGADRLGDDVLAVIDALHLQQRPVLVGHSIAGEELSSVGSRHPEKVAGLVYLDAAYGYAFYDRAQGDVDLDALEMRKNLEEVITGPDDAKAVSELIEKLPEFEKELQVRHKENAGLPPNPSGPDDDFSPIGKAIMLGQERYTEITVPVLAIFAVPHEPASWSEFDAAGRAAMTKWDTNRGTVFANAFEVGVPSAHVVRIPNADHYVFQSNEAQVLKEMDAFIAKLPK